MMNLRELTDAQLVEVVSIIYAKQNATYTSVVNDDGNRTNYILAQLAIAVVLEQARRERAWLDKN